MENPYRPGAGHRPPYLAGRTNETEGFINLLEQTVILQNLVLTGLRGIGKTVLLENFKPIATEKKWLWAGTDWSESASVNEASMATRILTDIALITSGLKVTEIPVREIGFDVHKHVLDVHLDFNTLSALYENTPGLVSDKLKKVFEIVWEHLNTAGVQGIVFAYDEAQTLSDHAEEHQYPFSILLDVFQSTQKKAIPFMLVLTGLPTLLTKLIECRTYTERFFKVTVLEKLNNEESRKAILKPLENQQMKFSEESIQQIIKESGGYPYFIQFMCKETFDIFTQQSRIGEKLSMPMDAIIRKLDNDFFAGRWAKVTERERDLMILIAKMGCQEFNVRDVVAYSKSGMFKAFTRSHISQMFSRLISSGLIYKNRKGIYSFAVPLLEKYILRITNSS